MPGRFATFLNLSTQPPQHGARFRCNSIYSMRFFAYILGFLIFIGGLAWAAIVAGAPQQWVAIGAVILFGLGIIMGASRTRSYRGQGDVTVVRDNDTVL